MIQNIYPHKYNNQYYPAKPSPDSFLLWYEGDAVLAGWESVGEEDGSHSSKNLCFPRFRDFGPHAAEAAETARYLFTIDEEAYFLAGEEPELPETAAQRFHMEKNVFREAEPLHQCFAGITGMQLKNWYESNQYCGRCGSSLEHAEKERMLRCPVCGNTIYPKISPAVIVAVTDGDRLLLTKYSGRAYTRYALIAGFNEIGESIEETVRREVMEEVGLKVKNLRYYTSQPWSFSETLLMGFWCELDGSDEIHLDTEELSVGAWLNRGEIPETTGRISLTGTMIEAFRAGREYEPFLAPGEKEGDNYEP